jgi:hypothetical protein
LTRKKKNDQDALFPSGTTCGKEEDDVLAPASKQVSQATRHVPIQILAQQREEYSVKPLKLPPLTLTGERHGDHYQIRLSGNDVGLTCSALVALVSMVIARAGPGTGFTPISRVTGRRLRQALDQAVGPGTGMTLIETGCGEEYRLTFAREHLDKHVAIHASFFELEGLRVITKEQAEALRHLGRGMQPK